MNKYVAFFGVAAVLALGYIGYQVMQPQDTPVSGDISTIESRPADTAELEVTSNETGLFVSEVSCKDMCTVSIIGGGSFEIPASFGYKGSSNNRDVFANDSDQEIRFSIRDESYNPNNPMYDLGGAVDPKIHQIGSRTFSSVVREEFNCAQEWFDTDFKGKTARFDFQSCNDDDAANYLHENMDLVNMVLSSFR